MTQRNEIRNPQLVNCDPLTKLGRELLHRDALVERMFGVEQQGQRAIAVETDINLRDVTYFELVGHRGHRAIDRLEHAQADRHVVGQDRPVPATRACRSTYSRVVSIRLCNPSVRP